MDLIDVAVLASMGVLAVFFSGVAVLAWRDAQEARAGRQADAQVIQHPRSDQKINPAA